MFDDNAMVKLLEASIEQEDQFSVSADFYDSCKKKGGMYN
jgi:hypothetical protein